MSLLIKLGDITKEVQENDIQLDGTFFELKITNCTAQTVLLRSHGNYLFWNISQVLWTSNCEVIIFQNQIYPQSVNIVL